MENIYLPQIALIEKIIPETKDTKTFVLKFKNPESQKSFDFRSGQFVEVSVFAYGEIPIGLSSDPHNKENFEITVRAVGSVSNALHEKAIGDEIGIRGPLGNTFPLDEMEGRNILVIGGGIGLPPLRSFVLPALARRDKFKKFTILYGARTPEDRVYKELLREWSLRKDIEFLETVDVASNGWTGNTGVVTKLFQNISIDPRRTAAYTCGPPIMIKFVIQELQKAGLPDNMIISTLERYMKCGVGKCGHCAIGHKYVCVDGPVFSFEEIKALPEAQ
jgi:sulfhydrogenase subunit gamma (sulfur reductase)